MQCIYSDQGSTSFPKPLRVAKAVFEQMTLSGANLNRGGYQSAYETAEWVFETRSKLCRLFHGPSEEQVIFTKNITESLNVLLKGLLRPGDHVLTSSMEHNAVMRPLRQLEAQGVLLDLIPSSQEGLLCVEQMEGLLRPETKAVVLLHASNVCGSIQPIEAVGDFCHKHGLLFILDTAQSAGVLQIDMAAFHIDGLAFTGHKGLLGPQGTGGFLLTEDLGRQITPLLSGGTGSLSHSEALPTMFPDRLEAGTPNLPGLAGLSAALDFLEDQGIDKIRAQEEGVCAAFLKALDPLLKQERLILQGMKGPQGRTATVSLLCPQMDLAQLGYRLDHDYGIQSRVGLHCAPRAHKSLGSYPGGSLRISFGFFNTQQEAKTIAEALEEILR